MLYVKNSCASALNLYDKLKFYFTIYKTQQVTSIRAGMYQQLHCKKKKRAMHTKIWCATFVPSGTPYMA